MKKTLILLIALLAAGLTVQAGKKAEAQTPAPLSKFSLGAYMSYWDLDDLDDLDISGAFGGGAIGQYRFNPYVALEMRLSGFLAGHSENVYIEGEGWYENDLTISAFPMEVGLIGFLPLGETFSLYGGPGIGYYLFDGQFTSTQGPVEITRDISLDDEVGYYVVLGGKAQLARNAALFADAKYTWVESSVGETLGVFDVSQDVDFSGLALEAGMIFTF